MERGVTFPTRLAHYPGALGPTQSTGWAPPTGLTNTSSYGNLDFTGGLPSRYSFSGQPVLVCRVIWLWRLNNFSSVYLSGSQFQSWGPTTLHILYVFLFNAPNSDHQLVSEEIHELRASDKRDTPNVQSSGTPGLELRTTGLPKQPNLLLVSNAELKALTNAVNHYLERKQKNTFSSASRELKNKILSFVLMESSLFMFSPSTLII